MTNAHHVIRLVRSHMVLTYVCSHKMCSPNQVHVPTVAGAIMPKWDQINQISQWSQCSGAWIEFCGLEPHTLMTGVIRNWNIKMLTQFPEVILIG